LRQKSEVKSDLVALFTMAKEKSEVSVTFILLIRTTLHLISMAERSAANGLWLKGAIVGREDMLVFFTIRSPV
jgi:hypothetical protein